MHKVININIGGRIFQIEENAFETLSNYINSLKRYFSGKSEGSEIVADIEHRIAELLQNKINAGSANVSNDDVSEIIASMGSPKDIAGDDENVAGEPHKQNTHRDQSYDFNADRSKIYRDPDGKVISGVCSGLAHYFDIDATIIRLLFIAFFFAGGSSIFIYLILLIVIPEARSTAEKLAMRKEKINIDTIQRSVEEEFGKIKGTFVRGNYQGRVSNFFQKVFHVIGLVVKAFLKLISVFVGVMFVIMALCLFIAMIILIIGNGTFNGHEISIFNIANFHFFENSNDLMLSQVAIVSGLFSVILIFFYLARLLLVPSGSFVNRKLFKRAIGTVALLASVLLIISGLKTASYFQTEATLKNKILLDSSCKKYIIKAVDHVSGFPFFINNDSLKLGNIELRIETGEGQPELIQFTSSHGQDERKARLNASNCRYNLDVKDSLIMLPESFILMNSRPYRSQEIRLILRLPPGTRFIVDKNLQMNVSGIMYTNEVIQQGRTYLVNETGISCVDCDINEAKMNTEDYDYSYPLGKISQLEVSTAMKIRVVKGTQTILRANGLDEKADLVVRDINGKLDIHLKNSFFIGRHPDVEVILITPSLKNISIRGSVNAEIEGFEQDELAIFCSGASKCSANLVLTQLNVELEGASEITLTGTAGKVLLEADGASKAFASEFTAQQVSVDASGASTVDVYAMRTIKARANGASNILYYGNPKDTDCVSMGAGKISRHD